MSSLNKTSPPLQVYFLTWFTRVQHATPFDIVLRVAVLLLLCASNTGFYST